MSLQVLATRARPSPATIPPGQLRSRKSRPQAPVLKTSDVRAIAAQVLAESKDGSVSEIWRRNLEAIDRSARFSRDALRLFQNLQAKLGIRTARPIILPVDSQPFWHRGPHPFANYQSTVNLPGLADVVIIVWPHRHGRCVLFERFRSAGPVT